MKLQLFNRSNVFLVGMGILLGISASPLRAQLDLGAELDSAMREEIRFINALKHEEMYGLVDKVSADAIIKWPQIGMYIRIVQLEALLAQAKWNEAKRMIAAERSPRSEQVWAMKLKMADYYFAFGIYPEARGIYESFFNAYPKGPTEKLNTFYRDSAYKFARMLLLLDKEEEALEAYKRPLKAKLPSAAKRQIIAEMAELALQLAEKTTDKSKREAYIKQVDDWINDELMWVQDVFFGKGIVMQAHIAMIKGDVAKAQAVINKYEPRLLKLDQRLREQSKEDGVDYLRMSPMAQCRYLLGTMFQERAEALMKKGNFNKQEALRLLAGGKDERGKRVDGALQHQVAVFFSYPQTPWAPDGGDRIEQIKDLLKQLGAKAINIKISDEKRAEVEAVQFRNAHTVFMRNQWENAAEEYLTVLNLYPEATEAMRALGNLAVCFLEQGDEARLFLETVVGHLGERFGKQPELIQPAGDQLLRLAALFEERALVKLRNETYDLYFKNYPTHQRAATTLLRFGERRYKEEDYNGAMKYFMRVVDQHRGTPSFYNAVNRVARIYGQRGDLTNQLKALDRYIEALADKDDNQLEMRAAEYRKIKALKQQAVSQLRAADDDAQKRAASIVLQAVAARYGALAKTVAKQIEATSITKDKATLSSMLEAAYFGEAFLLSRLPHAPEGRTLDALRGEAIQTYEMLLKRFPESKVAPAALMQIGTVYSTMGKPDKAEASFDRLREKYPESKEARNVLFNWAMALMELGLKNEAREKFRLMFAEKGEYSASQMRTAGQELLKIDEIDLALQAFETAIKGTDQRSIQEPALLGKAKASFAKAREDGSDLAFYERAVETLNQFFDQYPQSGYTVEASRLATRAFSEMAARTQESHARIKRFNRAIKAIRRVGSYDKSTAGKAKTSLEIARLTARKLDAEKTFGAAKDIKQARGEAIAAYQRFVMLSSLGGIEEAARPFLEQAIVEATALLVAHEAWQGVYDNCVLYENNFPDGEALPDIRTWKKSAEASGASAK